MQAENHMRYHPHVWNLKKQYRWTYLRARTETDTESRCMSTEVGDVRPETRIDIRICVVAGNLVHTAQGALLHALRGPRQEGVREGRDIYVYVQWTHLTVQQNLTQHCTATISPKQ